MNRADRRKRKLPNPPQPVNSSKLMVADGGKWLRENWKAARDKPPSRKIDGITEHELSDGMNGLFATQRTMADLKSWYVRLMVDALQEQSSEIDAWLKEITNPWWVRCDWNMFRYQRFLVIFADEADAVAFYLTWHGTKGVKIVNTS